MEVLNLSQEEIDATIDLETTNVMRNDLFNLCCMMIWSFAVLLRGLDIFLLFEKVRNFYVILMESWKDSKPFLILVIYICFVFGLTNSLLQIGDLDKIILPELMLIAF